MAGSGNETLGAASASGANIFFDGAGADLVNTGAGNAVVEAGTGAATVNMGAGIDLLVFVNGSAGGSALVNGFVPGTDHIDAQLYAGNPTIAAGASATIANNAITFTLPDNTTITLAGVTSLANVFA